MFAVFGILLLVAGAILTFAVERQADGVDLAAAGWILMAGGGLSLLVAAVRGAGVMSETHRRARVERHVSADGQTMVEESQIT